MNFLQLSKQMLKKLNFLIFFKKQKNEIPDSIYSYFNNCFLFFFG